MKPCIARYDSRQDTRDTQRAASASDYAWDHRFLDPMPQLYEPGTDQPNTYDHTIGYFFGGIIPRREIPGPVYLFNRFAFVALWHAATKYPHSRWNSEKIEDLQDYSKLFERLPDPWCSNNWLRDTGFAYQRLGGSNPMVIREATDDVLAKLGRNGGPLGKSTAAGKQLDRLRKEGRLFCSDYAILNGIDGQPYGGKNRYMVAPIGLFYIDDIGELRPLAIQLGQSPDAPVVCPCPMSSRELASSKALEESRPEERGGWLEAKTWFQVADINHHEMVTHLGRTHLILEIFVVATHRRLPPRHPIHVLLIPHFRYLVWNNFQGREVLINSGGYADQILAAGAKGCVAIVKRAFAGHEPSGVPPFEFWMWDLEEELRSRGVLETGSIPDFPYRDDGLLVWRALKDYVRAYLKIYYKRGDEDVAGDRELAGWIEELQGNGRIRGLAAPRTIEDLTTILTRIIWTAGPQHSAVNYAQYNFMAYVPNQPGAGYRAPGSGSADASRWLKDLMPPPAIAKVQMYTMRLLTYYRCDRLGYYKCGDFKDRDALAVIADFKRELAHIEATIRKRQANRKGQSKSYPVLQPSLITNSTSL